MFEVCDDFQTTKEKVGLESGQRLCTYRGGFNVSAKSLELQPRFSGAKLMNVSKVTTFPSLALPAASTGEATEFGVGGPDRSGSPGDDARTGQKLAAWQGVRACWPRGLGGCDGFGRRGRKSYDDVILASWRRREVEVQYLHGSSGSHGAFRKRSVDERQRRWGKKEGSMGRAGTDGPRPSAGIGDTPDGRLGAVLPRSRERNVGEGISAGLTWGRRPSRGCFPVPGTELVILGPLGRVIRGNQEVASGSRESHVSAYLPS